MSFLEKFLNDLDASVVKASYIAPKIVEIILHAPAAARHFKPGQFFRLQTYEGSAASPMKPLALTGAYVEGDLLGLIVLEVGPSSSLCIHLKHGEKVSLMGPAGTPTTIRDNENVLLIGGGLGNAVLFSIGQAMRARQCYVRYFAGYKFLHDRYKVDLLEGAADEIVWCCDEAPGFLANRPQDQVFVGNLVQALHHYQDTFFSVDRLLVIGSNSLMEAVAKTCVGASFFKKECIMLASCNSPMQCMLKEICAQCIQRHVDQRTQEVHYVYSCVNQDQPLEKIDFSFLKGRLMM